MSRLRLEYPSLMRIPPLFLLLYALGAPFAACGAVAPSPVEMRVPAATTSSAQSSAQHATVARQVSPGLWELTFPDGATYRGSLRDALPDGWGEYAGEGFQYTGQFRDGAKQGEGEYRWENGDRDEGRFEGDRPQGRGTFHFANGDTYEGDVKAGTIAGRGSYVSRGGDTY